MNIANQILFAVVITSVTGTAAYGLWRLYEQPLCTKPQYVYLALSGLPGIPDSDGYGWIRMTIHGYLQKNIWQINFSLTGFYGFLRSLPQSADALVAKGITEFAGSLRGMKRIQCVTFRRKEAVREEFYACEEKAWHPVEHSSVPE